MGLNRPSRQQLIDQSMGDIDSRLAGAEARLPRSFLQVLATVLGGALDGVYGYVANIAAEAMADTSDGDYLLRDASLYNIFEKVPTAAIGPVSATGTDGATVLAGTILVRADGVQFATQADATLAGGATLEIEAVLPGSAGNTDAGATLAFVSPVDNVNSTVTVTGDGIADGNDVETPEELRARFLARRRNPPQASSADDYVRWAKSVAGVTRAWCFPGWMGPGTIGLTFVDDDASPIIPSDALLAAVGAYIESVRSARGTTYYFKPTAVTPNLTIHINPSNATTQAAVIAALQAMLAVEATPGGNFKVGAITTAGGLTYLSHIRDAVQGAPGILDSNVSVPAINIQVTAGQLTTGFNITWI